ncbi:HAD family phosphatase [Rhizobiales bacterium]|uniref:HAD family hydrolase n=1 Tax=Hongsoonwoonella zoysiae TaxID=2821844 RepID=UPI00156012D8|nr:HAD family phosphatase [Hongsoonwoonella zoysiae]NRG19804.1 HAD family phosphatase [Hongsoonwoonella zoysiae]
MASQIAFVIFDMAGVLYDWDTDVRLEALSRLTGRKASEIDKAVFQSDFEERAEAGDPDNGEAYLGEMSRLLGHEIDRGTWTGILKAMMRPKPQILAIASEVVELVDTILLTNNGMLLKEVFPDCAPEAFDIFGENAYVSAEFGARKPARELYARVCERYDHDPAQTLFIDDSEKNVKGAEDAGMHAHLFTDAGSLRAALKGYGVL